MTGIPIVLGNDRSPNETFIQVAGNGLRIAADKLREAISQSRSLELALLGFAHAFMNQTANTALSNGTATLRNGWPDGFSWPMIVSRGRRFRSPTSFCRLCSACDEPVLRSP